MQALEYVITWIEYLLYAYFTMSGLYVFVFSLAGHLYRKRIFKIDKESGSMAILIPAYKEDAVIVEVAQSALKQQYASTKFDVVVIADSLKDKTIQNLKRLPVILVEVSFEHSTKSKALNAAMAALKKPYDHVIVLDADNIMEPEFLKKMNAAFNNGYHIVQGHRKAKNLNTAYAILDAASEEINNHIFRKGHRALGLSSGLIGSGMGFEYNVFKSVMKSINAVGGFDKELEFKFALKGITIEYLQNTVLLDEKIQKSSDFSNQRRRWLATQFVYLKKYFVAGWKELLVKGNINFFDKVWQMIIPPRLLLLGITGLISLIYGTLVFMLELRADVMLYLWLLNLSVIVSAFLLGLPKSFYNINTLKALLSIPSAFFRMMLLLFKLKGANKEFIHTAHGVLKIKKG